MAPELRTAEGITVGVSSPAVGRVDITVTGVDTIDLPIVMVTAHSIGAVSRTCNSRALQAVSATNRSFQFVLTD